MEADYYILIYGIILFFSAMVMGIIIDRKNKTDKCGTEPGAEEEKHAEEKTGTDPAEYDDSALILHHSSAVYQIYCNSLYPAGKVWKCPLCDAENPERTSVCCVCGSRKALKENKLT